MCFDKGLYVSVAYNYHKHAGYGCLAKGKFFYTHGDKYNCYDTQELQNVSIKNFNPNCLQK